MIKAPWTPEQVEALNAYQRSGRFHPFTCGNDRFDQAHAVYTITNGLSDYGILIATEQGWICPCCDYRQDWAHAAMAQPLSDRASYRRSLDLPNAGLDERGPDKPSD
ncbi:MAG: hypothetical protein ACM31O_04545 [Bacteroidota bacterium]